MKCFNPKCKSGKQGELQPIILLWGMGCSPMSHQPAELTMQDCLVCVECKGRVRPSVFIRDIETWTQIVNEFRHNYKVMPDLSKAQMAFVIPESLKTFGSRLRKGLISCH